MAKLGCLVELLCLECRGTPLVVSSRSFQSASELVFTGDEKKRDNHVTNELPGGFLVDEGLARHDPKCSSTLGQEHEFFFCPNF